MAMSDSSEGSSSFDWTVVNQHGDVTDEDSVSTTSSLEVVNDDDEEDTETSVVTPVTGSPNTVGPRFVLRLPSQQAKAVESDDEDNSGTSNSRTSSSMSGPSGAESGSSLTSTEPSHTDSTAGLDVTPTQPVPVKNIPSSPVSLEEIDDLRQTLDLLKAKLQPSGSLQATGKDRRKSEDNQAADESLVVRNVESIGTSTVSVDSSISSSYSFLSREAVTECSLLPGLESGLDQEPAEEAVNQLTARPEKASDLGRELASENTHQPGHEPEQGPDIDLEPVEGNCSQLTADLELVTVPESGHVEELSDDDSQMPATAAEEVADDFQVVEEPLNNRVREAVRNVDWSIHVILAVFIGCSVISMLSTVFIMQALEKETAGKNLQFTSQLLKEKTALRDKVLDLEDENSLLIQERTGLRQRNLEQEELLRTVTEQLEFYMQKTENLQDQLDMNGLGGKNLAAEHNEKKYNSAFKEPVLDTSVLHDEVADKRDVCLEYQTSLHQLEKDIHTEREKCRLDQDAIKAQAEEELRRVRTQFQSEMDQVRGQCLQDMEKVRTQCQNDIQAVRSQKKLDLHDGDKSEIPEGKSEASPETDKSKSAEESLSRHFTNEKESSHKKTDHKNQSGYHNSGSKKSQSDDSSENQSSKGDYSSNFWTETVLDMMNKTRGKIESTWEKVKNMSESLWNKHQPALYRLQEKFAQKVQYFGNKLQDKLQRKVNKWFKRAKKHGKQDRGQNASTKRRDFESEDFKPAQTLEEQLVKLSHRISGLTFRQFQKRKNQKDMLNIQKDLDRISSLAVPAHNNKDSSRSLSSEQKKWLTCQLQWWNDRGTQPVGVDCVTALCCWQVKVYGGDAKQCRKNKRSQGLLEDSCSLEDLKEPLGPKNQRNNRYRADGYSGTKTTQTSAEKNADWYFERGEDRQFQRSEPDTWFFRRKNKHNNYWRNRWMYSSHMPHKEEPMYCHFDWLADSCP